ncbi:MAG: GGDEF domain-containing response regulator [Gammaproteobacteria bacterium]|nr:MAG: GGDEF domain-containing response regulator [Gammaproteobacteria bacterium]
MSRILIIEESTTLRFLLSRSFEMDSSEVITADSIDDGIHQLQTAKETGQTLDGVVFSWPVVKSSKLDTLLALITKADHRHIATVVLAVKATDEILNWISTRELAALTLLAQYNDVPATLHQLFEEHSDHSETLETVQSFESPIHILFVDDSKSIRTYYQRLLKKHDYNVTIAASVEEAWTILNQEIGNIIDLVITDYFMPDENGYVLCRHIRKSGKHRHILSAVLTGTYMDEAIKRSLDAGAIECMFKEEADELFLARVFSMARMVRIRKSVETEKLRLAGILSSVGEGVYGVDHKGVITFINPTARNILGYKEELDVIGSPAFDLLHHVNERGRAVTADESVLQQSYNNAEALRGWETLFMHNNGRMVPVECTIVPLFINNKHEGSVVAFRDISERKGMEQQLRWQATHDPLTELHNRRYFEEQLETEFQRLKRSDQTSALLFLDLDRFKYINDTAGHDAGDKLLVTIGKQLKNRARSSDTLARLGGDEFAIILRDINSDTLFETADSYREVLASLNFSYGDNDFKANGSIGVTTFDRNSQSASDIMVNADIACHQAKLKGRDQTHIYDPENDARVAMSSDLGWANRLQDALENDHFTLNYQPILDMSEINLSDLPAENGELWEKHRLYRERTIYVEALIRMVEPNGELIMPNAFLCSAERFGLMPKLDLWSVRNAIETLEEVIQRNQNFTLAVNLSAITLDDEQALEEIKSMIRNMNAPKQNLALEVTETSAIASMHSVKNFIDEVKVLGCRFALDDFGAGFSSFAQLRHLPIDFVKIDGQYVENMARDAIDRAVVTAVNDVAHSIGRHTIAEYVSNPETLRLLKICGVDYVQGFYISEPMSKEKLLQLQEDERTLHAGSVSYLRPVS